MLEVIDLLSPDLLSPDARRPTPDARRLWSGVRNADVAALRGDRWLDGPGLQELPIRSCELLSVRLGIPACLDENLETLCAVRHHFNGVAAPALGDVFAQKIAPG